MISITGEKGDKPSAHTGRATGEGRPSSFCKEEKGKEEAALIGVLGGRATKKKDDQSDLSPKREKKLGFLFTGQ